MGCGFCKCAAKDTQIAQIKKDRSCTDILGLLGFILSCVVYVIIIFMIHKEGADWRRTVYPVDMAGRICGISPGVEHLPLGAMPYPWTVDGYKTLICLENCTQTSSIKQIDMTALYPSIDVLGFCVPVPFTNLSINVDMSVGGANPQLMEASNAVSGGVSDAWTCRYLIGIFMVVAVVVAFAYMWFLHRCAKTLIYSLLVVIIAFGFGLSQGLLAYARDMAAEQIHSEQSIQYLEFAGYFVLCCVGLFTLICFFMRNQIDIAIEVNKEAALALIDMKSMILFPIIPALLVVVYTLGWTFVAANIYSLADTRGFNVTPALFEYQQATWMYYAQETKSALVIAKVAQQIQAPNTHLPIINGTQALEYVVSDKIKYIAIYHIFHFFLVVEFIAYFSYLTFAGAAANWYFSEWDEKENKKRGDKEGELTNSPLFWAWFRTLRYHMGTVAVCAFLIAVVKTLRTIILYLERSSKGTPPNQLQKALFCALQCFLKCMDCCLDKINKNALVWTAVYGDGFCVSVCSSFALVWRNLFRVAAINVVSHIIFTMGELSIALVTAGLFVCIINANNGTFVTVTSPLAPACIVLFGAFVVAKCFFTIFDATINTMFFCFLVDSEKNGKGQMMASKALQKLVGKYKKNSTDEAWEQMDHRKKRGGAKVDEFREDHEEEELIEKKKEKKQSLFGKLSGERRASKPSKVGNPSTEDG